MARLIDVDAFEAKLQYLADKAYQDEKFLAADQYRSVIQLLRNEPVIIKRKPMNKYAIRVVYTDCADVIVEAETPREAEEKFNQWFDNSLVNQQTVEARAMLDSGIHTLDFMSPVLDNSDAVPDIPAEY